LIQQKIDSAGWNYTVINSGLSGETTAGGKNRIGWVLRQKVDVFVLELGGNDGLRGIELESTRQNLQAIIDTVRAKNPQVQIVLAGMQIPPNMGPAYTGKFRLFFRSWLRKITCR
jgi:acyl-CoA thioesterase-1